MINFSLVVRCQFIETRMAGGGWRASDAHPMDAKKRQMASVPAARSGPEDDMRRDAWRIRVGDYRVIYEIHDRVLQIIVTTVGHRREVYR